MSRILDSMSQSTAVSYSQMVQQLSQESSEKAHDSQVTVILSLTAKQVIASLIAQQLHLLRMSTSMKGGDHWDNTMVMFMEFIVANPFRTKLENRCMENGRVVIFFSSIDQS